MHRQYKLWISVAVLVAALIVSLFFSPFNEYFDNNKLTDMTITTILSGGTQYPGLSLSVNSERIVLSNTSSGEPGHTWNVSSVTGRTPFIGIVGKDPIAGCSSINVVLNIKDPNAMTATIDITKNNSPMNIMDFLNSKACTKSAK